MNSVNFPNCDMGICSQAGRVAVFHKNSSGMISKFTTVFGNHGINITDMTNKSRGDWAYTMLDLEQPISDEVVAELKASEGVVRVRVVK